MIIKIKSIKKLNYLVCFLLFLFFLALTIGRIILPTQSLQGDLFIMETPLNDEVTAVADPIKDMQEMVFPEKFAAEPKNKLVEEAWNNAFNQFAKKITIKKDTMHRFDFMTKTKVNADVILEFYDSKKEFVFSYQLSYYDDDKDQLYVNFPGAGEYYILASVPLDINGKLNVRTLNELEKFTERKIYFNSIESSWKIWKTLLPAAIFFLLLLLVRKIYQNALSSETIDLMKSLQKLFKNLGNRLKTLLLLPVTIAKKPLPSFKYFTLLLPFLVCVFFLLLQFGIIEKTRFNGPITLAPIDISSKEDPFFNFYTRKITVTDSSQLYKFRINTPGWELDSLSGNAQLILMDQNKKAVESFKLSFYHYETCCNSDGDDYTNKNYSEAFLYRFPTTGDYFVQITASPLSSDVPNAAQYNTFKDNTGGELNFSASTSINFGERPFNGILFFACGFFIVMGSIAVKREQNLENWNFTLLFFSFLLCSLSLYLIVNEQISWNPDYFYLFLASTVSVLMGALNFKGAFKVLAYIFLFIGWMAPLGIIFALLMTFLFAFQPVGGLVFFFIGLSKDSNPAFLYWSIGLIIGFILWMIFYMKTRYKMPPSRFLGKIVEIPYARLKKW